MYQLPEKCLSIVVPAYNEAPTLRKIVERLLDVPHLLEIIIIDDGSTDGTGQIAKNLETEYEVIQFLPMARNSGKTAALEAGIAVTSGDIVVIQDADLEYDPVDIPGLIEPIYAGFADVVYGSRFMVKRATRVLYYYHYVANTLLTLLSNTFTNLNFTDISTCYKAFRGDLIRNIRLRSSGFGFCIEVTAKIAKIDCVKYEVPISYYGRTYEEGKKIDWVDGLMAFYNVFRYNLFCSRKASFRTLPSAPERTPARIPDSDTV